MGGWFGASRKKHRVLVLGPRAAGKTTVMYRLSRQPVPDAMVPTAADVIEKYVESPDGHRFVFAEQKRESPRASAIVYVVAKDDAAAQTPALQQLLEHGVNPCAPLVVLVNKQDTSSSGSSESSRSAGDGNGDGDGDGDGNDADHGPGAGDALEVVAAAVAPHVGTGRSWAVLACSSSEDRGLEDVVTWLEAKLPL